MIRHRVAILGAGTMGRRHARVLSQNPRFEVVGVLDVDAAAARALSEASGVPTLATEREALERADAVVVATPIAAHAPMVRRALAAGRHVLVEKPVAGIAAEARALLEAAEDAERLLFVGHSERFNPVVRALARLVEPASILAIEIRRVGSINAHGARAHGALLNLGVHDLDLLSYLTRSGLTLRHALGRIDPAQGIEESAHVLVRTGSGAAGHLFVDQRPGPRNRTLALTTKARVFHGDLLTASLVCTCRNTGLREEVTLGREEPLALQADAFADALEGRPAEIATGFDGARALVAAERAFVRIRDAGRPRAAQTLGQAAQALSPVTRVAAEKL